MTESFLNPPYIQDYQHFEQHIAKIFSKAGWKVETAKNNQPGYDLSAGMYNLIVKNDQYMIAIQVKWLKGKVSTPQILKFSDFLDSEAGKQFDYGFFITTKGFSNPVLSLIKSWDKRTKIYCGIASESKIDWIKPFVNTSISRKITPAKNKTYFGIFTCKGGVGKTTVSAHLAGAFLLQELNVALIDLDPEQNLSKLVGDGVYVPNPQGGIGHSIEVFKPEEWDENAAPDAQLVICDCSPAFERNPKELIAKFDYCLIPTTLNPLGINKHGKVIEDTVQSIRKYNQKSHLFVVVNNYKKTSKKKLSVLRKTYLNAYYDIEQQDDRFHCIDPEQAAIRSSDQLYYWGIHLLENPDESRSELAFTLVGGRCHPREDFINLADYIETAIGGDIFRSD
ncbi:MAG: AAA family ATPase [Xenococcaceae cyanobacterium MO_188.B19]|nr:AAA family ATPase [Xenococcaceae cyanobacterium MO_188.B19]